jgi:hypothetical protein
MESWEHLFLEHKESMDGRIDFTSHLPRTHYKAMKALNKESGRAS